MFKLCITGDIGFEFWKDIEDYEGLYQVSTYGRVKSFNYNHTGKEQILKPSIGNNNYLYLNLWKNRKKKTYRLHILAAQIFLPCLNRNFNQVNHKDENKENNRVENLEFCSAKYNCNYGSRNQRISETKTNGKKSKKVLQFSIEGQFIKEFPSTMEIERKLGFSHVCISYCCSGKSKTSHGYIWRYV